MSTPANVPIQQNYKQNFKLIYNSHGYTFALAYTHQPTHHHHYSSPLLYILGIGSLAPVIHILIPCKQFCSRIYCNTSLNPTSLHCSIPEFPENYYVAGFWCLWKAFDWVDYVVFVFFFTFSLKKILKRPWCSFNHVIKYFEMLEKQRCYFSLTKNPPTFLHPLHPYRISMHLVFCKKKSTTYKFALGLVLCIILLSYVNWDWWWPLKKKSLWECIHFFLLMKTHLHNKPALKIRIFTSSQYHLSSSSSSSSSSHPHRLIKSFFFVCSAATSLLASCWRKKNRMTGYWLGWLIRTLVFFLYTYITLSFVCGGGVVPLVISLKSNIYKKILSLNVVLWEVNGVKLILFLIYFFRLFIKF